MTVGRDIPESVRAQLRPSFPRTRLLLRVFVDDPRASLCIDDVQILLYFLLPPAEQSSAPSRETLTQLLSHTVKQGWLERAARGRYAITDAGRAQLLEWLT